MARVTGLALLAQLLLFGCAMETEGEVGAVEAPLSERTQQILRCQANPVLATLSHADRARFRRGCELFFTETFDGNGRTCGSCHLNELGNRDASDNNLDFSPEDAQRIFDEDPAHALFRPMDSDDGAGEDYTMLLAHGLVRIPFVLPPNVTVDEVDSPFVRVDPVTGQTTVTVLRSTPSTENMALEESLMWDGRNGADGHQQAIDAVTTHFQAGRLPTAAEAADLSFFQEQIFTNRSLRRFAKGGAAPTLPEAPRGSHWDSVRRGREFFVSHEVVPGAPVRGGHCATCHSGPMLDTTNEFNPVAPAGHVLSNNFVSETNTANPRFPPGSRVGIQLPELTYRITATHDVVMEPGIPLFPIPPGAPIFPAGSTFTLRSSDPGRILTNGEPCELVAACLINSDPVSGQLGTTSVFRISSLWGSADTAPYFHDNSATTLEEMMDVYRTVFLATAFGTGNPAWMLSPQEEADILAYMRFAFTRDRDLLP
jgi:cytochrome c peroxidase